MPLGSSEFGDETNVPLQLILSPSLSFAVSLSIVIVSFVLYSMCLFVLKIFG